MTTTIDEATRKGYMKLVKSFLLVPIRSNKELKLAQNNVDKIFAKGELTPAEKLYVDALGVLIAAYEDEHFPIEPASDADMLRHLLDARGISQADLHRETGIAKSTISQILNGQIPFSRSIINKLANYFGVDKSVLSQNL